MTLAVYGLLKRPRQPKQQSLETGGRYVSKGWGHVLKRPSLEVPYGGSVANETQKKRVPFAQILIHEYFGATINLSTRRAKESDSITFCTTDAAAKLLQRELQNNVTVNFAMYREHTVTEKKVPVVYLRLAALKLGEEREERVSERAASSVTARSCVTTTGSASSEPTAAGGLTVSSESDAFLKSALASALTTSTKTQEDLHELVEINGRLRDFTIAQAERLASLYGDTKTLQSQMQ
ncbi:hypothetical protein HDV00_011916 [Rhizophlyctis rosea]|nr:hypothetical protein HDV00_011916 [Rhizophlyctis rosea]